MSEAKRCEHNFMIQHRMCTIRYQCSRCGLDAADYIQQLEKERDDFWNPKLSPEDEAFLKENNDSIISQIASGTFIPRERLIERIERLTTAISEARKALADFCLNHRQSGKPHPFCMHCGNQWTGELHGHRRLYPNDPHEPPIHKEGCPVLAGNDAIKQIDEAMEKPKCKPSRK